MLNRALTRLFRREAAATVVLRMGVVGLNFGVMIWLTYALGLAAFGTLVFLWGAAFVVSALVSCGGPLLLLRHLSDGSGLRPMHVAVIAVILPGGMCAALWILAQVIAPDDTWLTVLIAAFCINLLMCAASVMRALGSIQASMVLRDAAPFVALGASAVLAPGATAQGLLWIASAVMGVVVCASVIWCLAHPRAPQLWAIKQVAWWCWPMWGTSVLGMAIVQMDLIVGGMVMTPEALGLYALLRRIANVVALPVTVGNWVSARPVAAAYGARDWLALRQASARGNRIAWYPAIAIATLCLLGMWAGAQTAWLPVTPLIVTCFGILIFGALAQAFMASGFTVAVLSDHASLSASARAATVVMYLGLALYVGVGLSPVSNAVIYTAAMCLGNGLVWLFLLRDLDVDTSALVLLDREVRAWKAS